MRLTILSLSVLLFAACASSREEPALDSSIAADADPRARVAAFEGDEPDESERVVVDAFVLPAEGSRLTLAVRVRIDDGWHVYANVPPDQGYRPLRLSLDLPAGASTAGDWDRPAAHPSALEPSIDEWSGEIVFLRTIEVADSFDREDEFEVTVAFQACDERMCLAPRDVTVTATL